MIILSNFFDNGLFHFKHIMILVVSIAILVVWSVWAIRHLKLETFQKICLIGGLISEVIKAFTYTIANESKLFGYLPKGDLPLHMCSMQIILFAILVLSKNEKVKRCIRCFQIPTCLIGGIGAMFVATSSSLNMWPITITYFLYHVLITSFSLFLLIKNDPKLTIKDYLIGLAMYSGMIMVAIYVNSILYVFDPVRDAEGLLVDMKLSNVNFLYVINPPTGGLPILNKNHGWGVYIAHYLILFYSAITLVYIKPIIEFFKERKTKQA